MTTSNLDLARERFAGAGKPMPDDGAVMQQEFEDAIITLVLCWYDSQETDSPQEVSVLRYHIRQVIAADRELRQQADPELAQLHENGAKAWADVPDATAWVDELRGSAIGDSGAPVQFSPVFEAWAKSLNMDLSRTPEFYGDCNTDYAWLAWQAATANERERCAALADKGFSSCTRIESLFLGLMAEKIRRSDA